MLSQIGNQVSPPVEPIYIGLAPGRWSLGRRRRCITGHETLTQTRYHAVGVALGIHVEFRLLDDENRGDAKGQGRGHQGELVGPFGNVGNYQMRRQQLARALCRLL